VRQTATTVARSGDGEASPASRVVAELAQGSRRTAETGEMVGREASAAATHARGWSVAERILTSAGRPSPSPNQRHRGSWRAIQLSRSCRHRGGKSREAGKGLPSLALESRPCREVQGSDGTGAQRSS